MIKVYVIDASPIFVHGLTAILRSGGIQVVGARKVISGSTFWRADVLLVDPDAIPDRAYGDFVATVGTTTPVLLLGHTADKSLLLRYQEAGAAGFVNRNGDPDSILIAVRAVAHGDHFWTDAWPRPSRLRSASVGAALSPRERQVLRQIARGLTHSQIARQLGISPHTVDTYIRRARSKLDLGNKAELTRAALLEGGSDGQLPVRSGSGRDRNADSDPAVATPGAAAIRPSAPPPRTRGSR